LRQENKKKVILTSLAGRIARSSCFGFRIPVFTGTRLPLRKQGCFGFPAKGRQLGLVVFLPSEGDAENLFRPPPAGAGRWAKTAGRAQSGPDYTLERFGSGYIGGVGKPVAHPAN